jgi:hypothetical protein
MVWSTQASIENEVPSITAIIESICAGVFYWVVAIKFQTYGLLLTSLVVAVFVLIRSDESVALGVKWFKRWETNRWKGSRYSDRIERDPKETHWLILALLVLAILFLILFGGYFAFRLAQHFLAGTPSSTTLWAGSIVVMSVVSAVLAVAGVIAGLGIVRGSVALLSAAIVAIAAGAAIGLVTAIYVVAAVFLTFFGVLAQADIFVVAKEGLILILMCVSAFLPMWLGIALGVFIISFFIRVGATLTFFLRGVRNLPRNFRRLFYCTSPLQVPELVPGLVYGETDFTLPDVWHRFHEERHSPDLLKSTFAALFYPLAMVIWFVPGWAYRAILKSTVWFWYPLAYLGSDLRRAKNYKEFRRTIMGSLFAWTCIAVAFVTILVFFWRNFVFSGVLLQENPLITVLGYFVIADWSDLHLWQLLSIVLAATTIVILYWMHSVSGKLRNAIEDTEREARAKAELGWLERLTRARFVMFLLFQLLVGTQVLLYFNSKRCWFNVNLPANVESWAEWTYGQKLPLPDCTSSGFSK